MARRRRDPSRRASPGPDGAVPTFLVLLAVALTLAACGGDAPTTSSPEEQGGSENSRAEGRSVDDHSADDVVVTRDDASLPDGCEPAQIAGLIADFFRAFNAGDDPELSRTFAAGSIGPPLYGVGTGGDRRGAFGTDDRKELLRYFDDRHRHRERLRLLQVGVGIGGRQDTADVAYLAARNADDLETALPDARRVGSGGLLYFGKGVIDCRERKILAWNMDAEKRSESEKRFEPATPWGVSGPCPGPTGWKPGGLVVACAS